MCGLIGIIMTKRGVHVAKLLLFYDKTKKVGQMRLDTLWRIDDCEERIEQCLSYADLMMNACLDVLGVLGAE